MTMETLSLKRQLCQGLGTYLEYPSPENWAQRQEFLRTVGSVSCPTYEYLKDFWKAIEAMDAGARQEHYVQTFDLLPHCSLYISVPLFGEESFKRAELMAGLKRVYDGHGIDLSGELPDHLAVILRNTEVFPIEEWYELVSMAVLPAIAKMIVNLEKRENPYALVLKAVRSLLIERERSHA